jgi:hypothetical protein
MVLIGMDILKKVTKCVLLSPYIKGESPVSLLIVAKAESGKTSVMKVYRENKGIIYMTDATAYGLTRDILPKLSNGEVKTLMIADLITPLSRSTKTRKSFVAFLNNLIEEGIAKITTYATVWEKEVKCNVVTAITGEELEDARHDWAKMGFLSRFIVFSYSYPMSTVMNILNSYSISGLHIDKEKLKFPAKEIEIELPKEIANLLDPIASKIGNQMGLYGIRAKINLRSLVKSIAIANNHKTVTRDDYNELLDFANYMNFSFNTVQ